MTRHIALLVFAVVGWQSTAFAEETTGKITTILPEEGQFVLTLKDGMEYRFMIDEKSRIEVGGQKGRFADLRRGDEVTVTWEEMEDVEINLAMEVVCHRRNQNRQDP